MNQRTNIFDSNNWVTSGAPVWDGVTPNSVISDPIHVDYKAMFYSVNDFYLYTQDQYTPDVNNWTRNTPIVGTGTPTAENVIPKYIGQFYIKMNAPITMYAGTGTSNNTQWIALN